MDIHESHEMVDTPIGTQECKNCWRCICHSDLSQPCSMDHVVDSEVPD